MSAHAGSGRCPECARETIRRIGGEWCPFCRRFVEEVTVPHVDRPVSIRILRSAIKK